MIRKYYNKFLTAWNIYKFRRAKIKFGNQLRVRGHIGLQIEGDGECLIGNHFVCNSGNMSNAMGRNVRSFIKVGNQATLKIGDEVGMSSAVIRCAKSITIGNHVKIGALTIITDTDAHSLDYMTRRDIYSDADGAKSCPIIIEDDVFIGANCIICKGVSIGRRSIIGAGSVVTKPIPPDEIWAGNPAKFIKSLKI